MDYRRVDGMKFAVAIYSYCGVYKYDARDMVVI